MKNGRVVTARLRKVEKKKGMRRSVDREAGNRGRGKTERQIGMNSKAIALKLFPDSKEKQPSPHRHHDSHNSQSISRFV